VRQPNLADPDFEPTDEELGLLMRRAFADVTKRRDEAHERLRIEIARLAREAHERGAARAPLAR
jgi:hypothetical protein